MTNNIFTDPPLPSDKSWLAVERIEKEKRDKEELLLKEAKKKNPEELLLGGFFVFVKKVFLFLASQKRQGQVVFLDSVAGLMQYLNGFKTALVRLSQKDESQNREFVQQLSSAWHTLIEAINTAEWMQRRKAKEIDKINFFIKTISLYPFGEEHTLGFYLNEFAGREWLPFPFIQLLQTLHVEYDQKKEKSSLHIWITSLTEMIHAITPNPE